jgi:DNA gyrase subunit A
VTFLQGETIEIPFTTSDNADGRLATSWDAEWPTELGTHLRTLKVTDAAGNVTEETVEIIIRSPRVVPVTVRVNDQSVVFVLNEQQVNVDDYVIEVATAAAESDLSTLTWQSYQANLNIPDEEVVVTISHAGYIKRTNLSEYKVQKRGGVGSKGSTTRDKDFLESIFVATNHNYLLVFTEKGKCFWMRVFEIPEGSKTSKGRAVQNLINIEQDDKIKAYIIVNDLKDEDYVNSNFIVMCTKKGVIKKTSLEAYSRPRTNGINAININDGDELLEAKLTNGSNEIILAKKSGYAIRFNESTVRTVGRNSIGVKGVTMSTADDEVIGMICADPNSENTIMVVSENGYGKRSYINDPETGEPIYRITNRGGKGVKTINVTEKTGKLIAIKNVTDEDDLMIITKSGITIRIPLDSIRVMGRAAQGVKVINLKKDAEKAAVAKVPKSDEEDITENEINNSGTESDELMENND